MVKLEVELPMLTTTDQRARFNEVLADMGGTILDEALTDEEKRIAADYEWKMQVEEARYYLSLFRNPESEDAGQVQQNFQTLIKRVFAKPLFGDPSSRKIRQDLHWTFIKEVMEDELDKNLPEEIPDTVTVTTFSTGDLGFKMKRPQIFRGESFPFSPHEVLSLILSNGLHTGEALLDKEAATIMRVLSSSSYERMKLTGENALRSNQALREVILE